MTKPTTRLVRAAPEPFTHRFRAKLRNGRSIPNLDIWSFLFSDSGPRVEINVTQPLSPRGRRKLTHARVRSFRPDFRLWREKARAARFLLKLRHEIEAAAGPYTSSADPKSLKVVMVSGSSIIFAGDPGEAFTGHDAMARHGGGK
jgi:hypothetical protein